MAEQQAAQMQNQLNQLMTQVQRLTGELQESRQREGTLVERLNQVAQQQAQMRVETSLGPLVDAITESQKQVVAALQKDKKLTLIDNRGVAKPDKFGSKDEGFLRWKIRTESFILSVFPELEEPLTWAEEHEASIGKTDVEAEFGSAATIPVEEIHEKSAQVYAVLQNLLEGEAFTIVHNCPKGNGLEAWRKINKRYDPATGCRKGSLLRHILSPAKSKLEDLTANLEVWLDLIARYENRKDPTGARVQLQDEIKIAVLEQICPTELERHLQMSKARLRTFDDHREEITSFLETRLGSKLKIETIASASGKENKTDDAMDVGAVMFKGKGKGKGKSSKGKGKGFKGKGKGNKGGKQGKGKSNNNSQGKGQQSKSSDVCWHCGKSGHHQKDCWKKNGKDGKGGKSSNGKGGAKNGKSVNSVEVQDNPEPEIEQSYLELAMVEREEDVGGTADSVEPSGSARPPTRRPSVPAPKGMPMGLEVPSDFPDVGVSAMVRRLAYQRDLRLTAAGEPRHELKNWRNIPTTKYRQRAMAFSEASRLRGSMREELIRKITMAEGVDQACSSCDERYKGQVTPASKYAAGYVARMYSASMREGAYDDEESEKSDDDDEDDEMLRSSQEGSDDEEDEVKEGEVDFKMMAEKLKEITGKDCDSEIDGYSPSIAPEDIEESREVEVIQITGKDLEEIDAGAEADDEDVEDDCELEEILINEMPAEELGEDVSRVAKENRALVKKFSGLKMNKGQRELLGELIDSRGPEEELDDVLNSTMMESIRKELKELDEEVDKAIEQKKKEKKEKEKKDLPAESAGMVEAKEEVDYERSGSESKEQPADSAGLIRRRLTPLTSALMHRTIKSLNIGRLALEKKKVAQYIEEAEDEEEAERHENRLKEINAEMEKLKDHMSKQDRASKQQVVKLTEETKNSQDWHDLRYYKAREAGVTHGAAWAKEKKRRRAMLFRKKGMAERAKEKTRNEELWLKEFRERGERSDRDYESAEKMNIAAEGIETEVIEEGVQRLTVKGKAKKTEEFVDKRVRKALTKEEFESFREETKEDELRVMQKKEVDIGFKKRKPTESRKQKRKESSKRRKMGKEPCGALAWHGSCWRGDQCPFSHDVEKIQKTVCRFFVQSRCTRKNCPFKHSEEERVKYLAEKDLKRIKQEEDEEERRAAEEEKEERARQETKEKGYTTSEVRMGHASNPNDDELNEDVQWALWDAPWRARERRGRYQGRDERDDDRERSRSPRDVNALTLASVECDRRITVAFDTGAAVTTVPEKLAEFVREDGNEQRYRTASGELITDKGSTCILGQDERYNNKVIRGRVTEVRKTLASGAAVCKSNMVMLNESGGEIIPKNSNIAKHLERELEKAKRWYPDEAKTSTPLRIEKGVFVFDFWRKKEEKEVNAVEGERDVAAESAAASDPFGRQARKL